MHASTHNYNMYTVCITKLIFNEDDLEFVNQSRMFIGTPCTWYDANINFGRKNNWSGSRVESEISDCRDDKEWTSLCQNLLR